MQILCVMFLSVPIRVSRHTTETHNSMSSLKYALESENARVHQSMTKASRPPPLLPACWPSTLLGYLLYLSMLKAVASVQSHTSDIQLVLLFMFEQTQRMQMLASFGRDHSSYSTQPSPSPAPPGPC